jgi:hypothetical protein
MLKPDAKLAEDRLSRHWESQGKLLRLSNTHFARLCCWGAHARVVNGAPAIHTCWNQEVDPVGEAPTSTREARVLPDRKRTARAY